MLLHPIRQNGQLHLRFRRIVGPEMDAEVMLAAHVAVHHELQNQAGALAGLEGHRTDDRSGRSTSLYDFDVGLLAEDERLITNVR